MIKTKRQIDFENKILEKSTTTDYEQAKTEWYVNSIRDGGDEKGESHCVCGQSIRWLFTLKNTKNGNTLIAGSTCMAKFADIHLGVTLTKDLTKLKKSPFALLDMSMLYWLNDKDMITDKEFNDYQRRNWETVKKVNMILLDYLKLDPTTFFKEKKKDIGEDIREKIDQLIKVAEEKKGRWLKYFAKSISEQFETRGSLSAKQLDIVNKNI